ETLATEYPTKELAYVFYCNPIDCLQSLLSHALFEHHISFVPRKVWTSTAKICHIYGEWLSGDHAWSMQEVLPPGATLLGVVLSSDKTNILVMSGNCMAHPLLISLANIDAFPHSKSSVHAYILLALLPIAKFTHGTTHIHSLLQDQLVDQALNVILLPLSWTAASTMRWFQLNGVVEPCWNLWPSSDPSIFLTPEVLHHFHQISWDHDVEWCISVTGAAELDLCFSIIQTSVGYWAFSDGISRLKQVTACDQHAVQHYIIAAVAGSVPHKFLIAICTLLDFCYLAQVPSFATQSLEKVASSLQEFHNHKEAIVSEGIQVDWQIPKLELLQSVVQSIWQSGVVMQWSADITEHAHIEEIKVPAHAGNNQNYNNQIVCHLNWLDKCLHFDL
ncbi:hypothetical protein EDD17DRAFT_1453834, partial [Pisolithus thermaeus]